jgi:hypothetical protein
MKTCKATHKWFFRPCLPTATCSCGWDLIYMHKMHGKCKKWLKYSKRDPKCARKSILGCNGDCVPWNFFWGETMKSPMIGVRIATSPIGNYDPSCEMLRFARSDHRNLCQTLPKIFHSVLRSHHGDTPIFMIF